MASFRSAALLVATAAVAWSAATFITGARAQQNSGSLVTITGLGVPGSTHNLPTDASGSPYLPVRTQADDRQITFDAEMWQQRGELEPLLLNGTSSLAS